MSKKNLDKIVGVAYEDLDTEDMQQVQGAGDVDAETTVPIAVTIMTAVSAAYSAKKC